MKTYWDYSEKERSELTREQVQDLLKFELMEKGVAQVSTVELVEPVAPQVSRKRYFGFSCRGRYGSDQAQNICFKSLEDVEAFLKLKPFIIESNWEYGDSYKYVIPVDEAKMIPVDLTNETEVANLASRLKQHKAAVEALNKKREHHRNQLSLVEKTTEGVWSNWHECRTQAESHQQVIDTLKDYAKTCEGDMEMAVKFLRKLYSTTRIQEAHEWFGIECPMLEPSPKCAEEALSA